MSRINTHHAPDLVAIERNKTVEPDGERIRAEFIDWLNRNKVVSVMFDTAEHFVDIGIVRLPPRIKSVLTHWGSIYVRDEIEDSLPRPEQPQKCPKVPARRGDCGSYVIVDGIEHGCQLQSPDCGGSPHQCYCGYTWQEVETEKGDIDSCTGCGKEESACTCKQQPAAYIGIDIGLEPSKTVAQCPNCKETFEIVYALSRSSSSTSEGLRQALREIAGLSCACLGLGSLHGHAVFCAIGIAERALSEEKGK